MLDNTLRQSEQLFECRPVPCTNVNSIRYHKKGYSGAMEHCSSGAHATGYREWCHALISVAGVDMLAAFVAAVDVNAFAATIIDLQVLDVSDQLPVTEPIRNLLHRIT